jgi:hypothetical protein
MKFHDDGGPLSDDGFDDARSLVGIDAAALWAVMHVETRGFGFLPSRRPVIRFERHVFHRLTNGKFSDDHPEISNPVPGGYVGGPSEYARLKAAAALDPDAAPQSASWGVCQLMGYNWTDLGYTSIHQMVTMMGYTEDDQLIATVRFLDDECLIEVLRERDWQEFADRYNGAGFGRENYAAKLAAAFQRYEHGVPNLDIRTAQAALFYLGYKDVPIDGVMSPRTRAATVAYQRDRRIPLTGCLDRRMVEELCIAAFGC